MYIEHDTHIKIDFAKFEFFLYEKITRNIDEGVIFCNNSLSYKSLEDDFISNINEAEKLKLIEELGYIRVLTFANTRLEELCTALNKAWIRTNVTLVKGSILQLNSTYPSPKTNGVYQDQKMKKWMTLLFLIN